MSDNKKIEDIKTIHENLRAWCYAKRTENERAKPQVPLFTCMDEAIISVLADMESRLRKIEAAIATATNNPDSITT